MEQLRRSVKVGGVVASVETIRTFERRNTKSKSAVNQSATNVVKTVTRTIDGEPIIEYSNKAECFTYLREN